MTHIGLDALAVVRQTGDEPFTHQSQNIGAHLREFWIWACSDLLSNAMRGVLAEYIVGLALGCVDEGTRVEWDAADLRTHQGLRVEVKSSAYLQSWKQQRFSTISFDIKPAIGWDARTNAYATERARQADVYVFCVFTPTDKATADPLNLDQWDFYAMHPPSARLPNSPHASTPKRPGARPTANPEGEVASLRMDPHARPRLVESSR